MYTFTFVTDTKIPGMNISVYESKCEEYQPPAVNSNT